MVLVSVAEVKAELQCSLFTSVTHWDICSFGLVLLVFTCRSGRVGSDSCSLSSLHGTVLHSCLLLLHALYIFVRICFFPASYSEESYSLWNWRCVSLISSPFWWGARAGHVTDGDYDEQWSLKLGLYWLFLMRGFYVLVSFWHFCAAPTDCLFFRDACVFLCDCIHFELLQSGAGGERSRSHCHCLIMNTNVKYFVTQDSKSKSDLILLHRGC